MEAVDDFGIALRARPTGTVVPLTALQLRTWQKDLQQGEQRSHLRMCAVAVRVAGPLNYDYLRRSIDALIQRHETLRTRFVCIDGVVRQEIDASQGGHFEVLDLANLGALAAEADAACLGQEFIDELVDLSSGPLFATKLLRLSVQEHVLLVAVDHFVSDKRSCEVLRTELWTLYDQAVRGLSFSLSPLPIQFADYVVWQKQTYGAWLEKHGPYWLGRLAHAKRLRFPTVGGGQDATCPTRAMQAFPFGETLSVQLRGMSWRYRTLLPVVVLTIYAVAIFRWCRQADSILAFASHGRHRRPMLANMVGNLATPLYLRVEIKNGDSFIDLMSRLAAEVNSAYQHHDFDRVPDLIPECTLEHAFNWVSIGSPAPVAERVVDGSLELRPFPLRKFAERVNESFIFESMFSDTATGIEGNIWYRRDLFEHRTIEGFCQDLRLLADEFTQRPAAMVESVSYAS